MKTITTTNQKDPVCGLKINPQRGGYSTEYEQRLYFFCSRDCLDRFHQDSERFAKAGRWGLKGIWSRYIDRVQKATDGKPPCCH